MSAAAGRWPAWSRALGLAGYLGACAALALLSGCSTLTPMASAPASRAALPRADWHEFQIDGRVAVSYQEQRHFGRFSWRHWLSGAQRSEPDKEQANDELLISNPLGQGIAELWRGPAGARLRLASGEEYQAADAEQLLHRVLGLPLPVSHLPDWLLGRSGGVPGAELTHDLWQRPQRQRVAGWQIDYHYPDPEPEPEPEPGLAPEALPQRVSLSRPGEADGPEITLRIDTWQLP